MKNWNKTRVQNLVRHSSGRYYARAFSGGKEIWKSLKTSHLSVAKARLAEFMKTSRENQSNIKADASAKMTFGQALEVVRKKKAEDVSLKSTTKHYWNQVFNAVTKSWPGLSEREIRRVTTSDCEGWARDYSNTASPSRFNNAVSGLRRVFQEAIKVGVIYANPAAGLEKAKLRQKQLKLPSRNEFLKLIEFIAKAGAWCSRDCADFISGLAFTGCRKSEAAQIEWQDVEFQTGEIVVRGDPVTATKNWTVRRVPIIPDAFTLFTQMRAERSSEPSTAKVFRVREAQKAIDHAAKKIGMARITHHDLRHLFATICIESGVDIPTVSRWLGHKDGGALAMKTYGHLRREHSIAQAQKVHFREYVQLPGLSHHE
jgi:integrase